MSDYNLKNIGNSDNEDFTTKWINDLQKLRRSCKKFIIPI